MPRRICLMVMAGFHPSSSFRMERHTVPEGYTFGWKSGGTNLPGFCQYTRCSARFSASCGLHLGGFVGYSSGNVMVSLNSPPAHIVFALPGMPTSHTFRSVTPFAPLAGLAKNPNGWSLRHCLRSSWSRLIHNDMLTLLEDYSATVPGNGE